MQIVYFGKRRLSGITSKDVPKWQNEMIDYWDEKGKTYSPVYLRSFNAQLNAILNHAVKHYGLKANPTHSVRSMGRKQNGVIAFWTKEEYLKFAEVMMDKPVAYYAFEMLYWCGTREVVVQSNPRVYKALRNELNAICAGIAADGGWVGCGRRVPNPFPVGIGHGTSMIYIIGIITLVHSRQSWISRPVAALTYSAQSR